MKAATRYGTAKQAWWNGLGPALYIGTLTGALTYIACRGANSNGFKLGYKIGTPDLNDIAQAIEHASGDVTKIHF